MTSTEIWVPVKGYECRYMVSNMGRVMSLYSGHIARTYKARNGYLNINLQKNGDVRHASIHRLVAEAFVDNPLGLEEVNHIDGDKENNRSDNLEWTTHSGNMKHSVAAGLYDPVSSGHMAMMTEKAAKAARKPVVRDDGEVFLSISDAAKACGGRPSNISAVCLGKARTCMGYSFAFLDSDCDLVRRAKALAGLQEAHACCEEGK